MRLREAREAAKRFRGAGDGVQGVFVVRLRGLHKHELLALRALE